MKNDTAIKVEGLGKKYQIGKREKYLTLRDQLKKIPQKLFQREKYDYFWALSNLSFEIKSGEVIGVIGPNGAGKSTLLKILSRIVEPTTGKVILRGRVASILEVGTGFHQELSGRENVYLNGAILGMTRKEIQQKFDEIVEFSGIGGFIDTPVKKYSSGMYVRLAFSVAAHLESEVLIVDEVLSVGDSSFRKKCLGKMSSMSESGRTVIFVSHDMNAIQSLCTSALYLESGNIQKRGRVSSVIKHYLSSTSDTYNHVEFEDKSIKAQVIEASVENEGIIDIEDKLNFCIKVKINKEDKYYLAFSIYNELGQRIIFWRDFELDNDIPRKKYKGVYEYLFKVPRKIFVPGDYQIEFGLGHLMTREVIDQPDSKLSFTVTDGTSSESRRSFPWRSIVSIPVEMEISRETIS